MCTEKRLVTPVKLKIPGNLSVDEKSAVANVLKKWQNNRFKVISTDSIAPNTTVDLIHIVNNISLKNVCLQGIEKRWYGNEIGKKQIDECKNVNLTIVDKVNLENNGFICCVLENDSVAFAQRMAELSDYAKRLCQLEQSTNYLPDENEMCLVMQEDEDGIELWYRAQYGQTLPHERAQVKLIDFDETAVVNKVNI